jgi:hypothetical protein
LKCVKRLTSVRLAQVAAFCLFASSCDGTACLAVPCALPEAVTITVTSTTGAVVAGAFIQESALNGPRQCTPTTGSTCQVLGGAGKYELDIGAPGFQTVHRTVNVSSAGGCGCAVNQQHLDVALVPTP